MRVYHMPPCNAHLSFSEPTRTNPCSSSRSPNKSTGVQPSTPTRRRDKRCPLDDPCRFRRRANIGIAWLQPMLTAAVGYPTRWARIQHTHAQTKFAKITPTGYNCTHVVAELDIAQPIAHVCTPSCSRKQHAASLKILLEVLSVRGRSCPPRATSGAGGRYEPATLSSTASRTSEKKRQPRRNWPPFSHQLLLERRPSSLSNATRDTQQTRSPFLVALQPFTGLPMGLTPGTSTHFAGKTAPLGLVGDQDSCVAKSFFPAFFKEKVARVESQARGLANEYLPPRHDHAFYGARCKIPKDPDRHHANMRHARSDPR